VVAAFRNHAIFYPTASWIIGVALEPAHSYVKLTLPSAIAESAHRNMQMGGLILHFFASLVERRMSSKVISGPIQIAVVSNAAAQEGIAALLELIATISLNLAIINLLPMPILDGGMVLRLLIEAALGRDLDFAVRAAVARVGAALLLVLAVFVIYNDLSKLLLGG
jgi:regulator of sigma E protease